MAGLQTEPSASQRTEDADSSATLRTDASQRTDSTRPDVTLRTESSVHADCSAADGSAAPLQTDAGAATTTSNASLQSRTDIVQRPRASRGDDVIEDEWMDMLSAEVHIDRRKLVELSTNGIPAKVRCEVWQIFLEVYPLDKGQSAQQDREQCAAYASFNPDTSDSRSRVQQEAGRLRSARFAPLENYELRRSVINVISSYLDRYQQPFALDHIYLCMPFVSLGCQEYKLYAMYERLMLRINHNKNIEARLSQFLGLFASLEPALFQHFEAEALGNDWAVVWLQSYMSRVLTASSVTMLWDRYLRDARGFDIHPYVCVAFLAKFREELEELDEDHLASFLLSLPSVDIDEIYVNAESFRDGLPSTD
eukprot:m.29003 g.29003  ORF g.29003 m.29003 type:complete len:366 (-) comp40407_c0_seq3:257-1354(-)